jgi:acetoacetyl-CoA synthetase
VIDTRFGQTGFAPGWAAPPPDSARELQEPLAISPVIDDLVAIWQRVLQLSSVGIDDNFFDLGGDSSLTVELFHQIALTIGRELPPVMIYHAPTIASLAALLDQPEKPRVPAVVQLKPGFEHPPLFIAHGLGGSVIDFYQLVRRIHTSHTIQGLQAKGVDGIEEPMDRIEDMARYSLAAVEELQPVGPYYLIGFSLGGLVALEMAQQLVERGKRIGLLLLLDSYPHANHLSRKLRAGVAARQMGRWSARKLKWLGFRAAPDTFIDPPSPSLRLFRECSTRALQQYRPRYYPGKISFVRAAVPTQFPADPDQVWSGLAREFEIQTVTGDHLGIMTTHSEDLASAVSGYLRQALQQSECSRF